MGDNSHKVPIIEMSYMDKIYQNCNEKLEFLKKKIPRLSI